MLSERMGYDVVECGAFLLYGNGTGEEGCAGEAGEHGDVGTGSVYGGGDSGDRVHGGGVVTREADVTWSTSTSGVASSMPTAAGSVASASTAKSGGVKMDLEIWGMRGVAAVMGILCCLV